MLLYKDEFNEFVSYSFKITLRMILTYSDMVHIQRINELP